jgi:hypothetical protein
MLITSSLMPQLAVADKLIDTHSVIVEAGYDTDETETLYIDTQFGFNSVYWIQLAAQKNNVKSEYGSTMDSRSYFLGFGYDYGAQWSYDLTYENWGNPGDIETNALRTTVTGLHDVWALSVMPQYRKIDLAGTNNGDNFTFNERGLGVGVEYSGLEDCALYIEHYNYNFSRNPDRLEDRDVTESLTFTAISLASGFYEHETVLGIERWLNPVNITFQYTRDKSAIDNTHIKTTEAYLDYYLSDSLIPYLRIGRASFSGISPLWFGNLGLQIIW